MVFTAKKGPRLTKWRGEDTAESGVSGGPASTPRSADVEEQYLLLQLLILPMD